MKVSNVKEGISKKMHAMTILSVSNYQIEIIFTTTCTVEITKKKKLAAGVLWSIYCQS